jgi:hypothetical protein
MGAADYLEAVAEAEAQGVDLPLDPAAPGKTPWDPELREAFDERRLIIHEERLLPHLLHD